MGGWRFVLVLAVGLWAPLLAAESFDDHEFTGESAASTSATAKKEIIEQATSAISEGYIIEMIGEEKFKKNRYLIEKKILKESGRYIPILKTGALRFEDGKRVMEVKLSLSRANLKSLLLEQGLLYDSEGAPVTLPFVAINDQVRGQSYSWWKDAPGAGSPLQRISLQVEEALQAAFFPRGFYLRAPTRSRSYHFIPTDLKRVPLSLIDFQRLSKDLSLQVTVSGEVQLVASGDRPGVYQVQVHWAAINISNGRVVAEVHREYATEPGDYEMVLRKALPHAVKDSSERLAQQMLEAWQKGTFGASLMQLVLRGALEFSDLEKLKGQLMRRAKYVKGLRERFFEPGQVTLEADVSGTPSIVAEIVSELSTPELALKVAEINSNQLVFDLVRSSAVEAPEALENE